jgi:hypothetical protein
MIVIVQVVNNRVATYAEFDNDVDADRHKRRHGGIIYAGSYSPHLYVEDDVVTEVYIAPPPEDPMILISAAELQALKTDAKFQNLISKTPAQAKNWVQNSFPSLTDPEHNDLATIVQAIIILGRRL